jgi:hypothetical protein
VGAVAKRAISGLATIAKGKSVSLWDGIAITIQQFDILCIEHGYFSGFRDLNSRFFLFHFKIFQKATIILGFLK